MDEKGDFLTKKYKKIFFIIILTLIFLNVFAFFYTKNSIHRRYNKLHKTTAENIKNIFKININEAITIKCFFENSDHVECTEYNNFVSYIIYANPSIENIVFCSDKQIYCIDSKKDCPFFEKYKEIAPYGISIQEHGDFKVLIYKLNINAKQKGDLFAIFNYDSIISSINLNIFRDLNFSIDLYSNRNKYKDYIAFSVYNQRFIVSKEKSVFTPVEKGYIFALLMQFLFFIFGIFILKLKTKNHLLIESRENINLEKELIKENQLSALVILDKSGLIIDVNKKTSEMLGYKKDLLLKKSFHEFIFNEKDRYIFLRRILYPENSDRRNIYNIILKDKYDNKVPCSVLINYKYYEGKIVSIILNFQDLREHIEKDNLINDLESFTGSVSHDLLNPLSLIQGYTDLIDWEEDENKRKEYLSKITKSCNNMRLIIEYLLEFSRISKKQLKKEDVNLTELVSELLESHFEEKIAKVKFKLNDTKDIKADKDFMKLALTNLISNALKYSSKEIEPIIEFGEKDGVFYIKDNGVGFSMKEYQKLFKNFSRLHDKSQFKGFGLGLNTVKRIIEKHGGKIWAESAEDQGATFFFKL